MRFKVVRKGSYFKEIMNGVDDLKDDSDYEFLITGVSFKKLFWLIEQFYFPKKGKKYGTFEEA